jgi:hypothetical protein
MVFSIFDSSGNLVDAFADRADALAPFAAIVAAEPAAADDVFLVAQDETGAIVGETVFDSSLSVCA